MTGRIEFNFDFSIAGKASRPRETDPMKILILGDFSASTGPDKDIPLDARRIHPVDIDTFDRLLSRFAPRLELQLDDNLTAEVSFSGMDEFHPDSLYRRLGLFDELRDILRRLSNNQTFPEAAAQLRAVYRPAMAGTETAEETSDPDSAGEENDSSTLERLLGRPATTESQSGRRAHSAVERLIAATIKDQIVPEADPQQGVYTAAAEEVIGQLMRGLLHHPDFRSTEALWRGLDFLLRRTELDENLELHVYDVSRDELLADFQQAGDDLTRSGLFQRLVTQGVQTPGNSPWSLIVGAYEFDASATDIAALAALGAIAAQAGGPFLAAADPAILGCRSLVEVPDHHDWMPEEEASENWNTLRQSEVAPWIGLALPRILMRLPYGENTDEIDAFDFEEITESGKTERLLWGNPAIACAQLIARSFTERGWQMQPDDVQDIGDLPAHSFQDDGEWKMTPCAEAYLSEAAIHVILERGLIPLISLKNTNSVRLLRFQSISRTRPALAGPWHA